MKLTVEQVGGPFYNESNAPPEQVAATVNPPAEVVDCAGPSGVETETEDVPGVQADLHVALDLEIKLARCVNPSTGREEFRLQQRIAYNDPELGRIVVPADLANWTTDLTSVPPFLTWLVPKTGAHLPAAILHDGMVLNKNEPCSYIAARKIRRDEADRVFRDAMLATGTPRIRAWLVWAAVTAATMHHGQWDPDARWQKGYYRLVLWSTLAVITVLGAWSILDVLDAPVPRVPWMGDHLGPDLLGGLAGSIVIPLILGTMWGRFRTAGWIIGPLAAILLVSVLPILFVGAFYLLAEKLQQFHRGLARAVAVLIISAAVAAFVAYLVVDCSF